MHCINPCWRVAGWGEAAALADCLAMHSMSPASLAAKVVLSCKWARNGCTLADAASTQSLKNKSMFVVLLSTGMVRSTLKIDVGFTPTGPSYVDDIMVV